MAEVGPSAHHAVRSTAGPTRVDRRSRVMRGAPVVAAPLPNIAGHVVETKTIRGKRIRGCGSKVAVVASVVGREDPLPDVALVFAVGQQVVSPRVEGLLQAAPCRVLPLRLGRQPAASPPAVGIRILMVDVHHRVGGHVFPRGTGPERMPPVRPVDAAPPRGARGALPSTQRAGEKTSEHKRPSPAFCAGLMSRGLHELGELGVGDCGSRHQERGHRDPPEWAFTVGGVNLRTGTSHDEGAAGQVDELGQAAGRRRPGGLLNGGTGLSGGTGRPRDLASRGATPAHGRRAFERIEFDTSPENVLGPIREQLQEVRRLPGWAFA